MRTVKIFVFAIALTAGLGVSGLAAAADNCSGYGITVGARFVRIDKTRGPSEAQHAVAGACDTERCTLKDKDGDEYSMESAYIPGDEAAKWRIVAGTGKYANAGWSGWYKQTRTDGDVLVHVWGGDCKKTVKRTAGVRLSKDEMRSIFNNALVRGTCTDGATFENVYGSGGTVEHTTRSSAGQLLFGDANATWFPDDADDGSLLCFKWSSGGTSCWKNYRDGDRYVGREQGGQGRSCWFTVVPR